MSEAEFEAHVSRNRAQRGLRAQVAGGVVVAPKPVPALLQGPVTFGGGAIEFTVPGTPIPKGRPRFGKGHTYTPKRTLEAENVVRSVTKLAEVIPIVGAVAMHLDFFLPIPKGWSKARQQSAMLGTVRPITRTGDWDNLAKLVCDGLNGIGFDDDCQIVECTVRKWYSIQPRTVVKIVPLDK